MLSDPCLNIAEFTFMKICAVPVMKSMESGGTIAWHNQFDSFQLMVNNVKHFKGSSKDEPYLLHSMDTNI